MTLGETLGYAPDDRLIILNADDFGMCQAANAGIAALLASGGISSATVMLPCGWAPQAVALAKAHPSWDVGLHLTFTSEWETYRWAPLSTADVSTLVDDDGYFPRLAETVEEQASVEDIAVEIEAQLARARTLGLSLTHADNHMGSLYGVHTGRDFLDVTLRACARAGLPFRLPRHATGLSGDPAIEAALAQQLEHPVALADELGVVIPDYLWSLPFAWAPGETYESLKRDWLELLAATRPGVTELYMHPFAESDEIRAISPDWRKRVMELRLFGDPDVHALLRSEGITLINWRQLQQVQHARQRTA